MLAPIMLLLSLAASYVWVSSPELRPYSLQLTAVLMIFYFISKRFSRSAWYHILPNPQSLETSFLVAGVALIIGSSGGIYPHFAPLVFVLLFFGALTFSLGTNLTMVIGLTLFSWAVSPHPFSRGDWIQLLSLLFLLPLVILARIQFEEARHKSRQLEKEVKFINTEEAHIGQFLQNFLRPKLKHIREDLLIHPQNIPIAAKQLAIIEEAIQVVEENVKSASKKQSQQKKQDGSE